MWNEIENRCTPSAYGEADLRVEHRVSSGLGVLSCFGQQRFEFEPIDVPTQHAVTVMIDVGSRFTVDCRDGP